MLSQAENVYVCHIGPGRWLPALISTELAESDGAPLRLTLMGEQLVACRDSTL